MRLLAIDNLRFLDIWAVLYAARIDQFLCAIKGLYPTQHDLPAA